LNNDNATAIQRNALMSIANDSLYLTGSGTNVLIRAVATAFAGADLITVGLYYRRVA
jgi:hypothetical protein